MISKALPFIGPHLVKLLNASFAQGVFPETWRRARLLALKKLSVPSTPSDFRPIALLCFLATVLEKLAHDRMASYLEESGLLDLKQTGFRKYNSTKTALIKLPDDIRMGTDKKLVTFLLFFDFSKAFHTILPFRLLVKLKNLGFSGGALRCIGSYSVRFFWFY